VIDFRVGTAIESRGVQNSHLFCIRLQPQQPEAAAAFIVSQPEQHAKGSPNCMVLQGLAPATTIATA